MASQGPNSPGTATNVSFSGGISSWNSVNLVFVADGSIAYSSAFFSSTQSEDLQVTNFGFSIPGGSTINGIVVEVLRRSANSVGNDVSIRIVKGGAIQSTNLSTGAAWNAGTLVYDTFGSSSELWGTTWSASDINDSGFGFAIAADITIPFKGAGEIKIDHIRITVHYTAGGGGSAVKTVSGLAQASVKTVEGLAIASTKSIQGLV